ncbi:DUF4145 domain-containing protein [Rhizobium leguminosarum]|uniref:DUF4145 domain-containing protein n=1 Tax=Rhizobium leguminosarum TaxID=384 RepID=UPI0014413333|nr:DUF4145 domain-containing protein [Rhizobium leguminosarum]MBY5837087.1 DUF4145 domain-containing protein [Rhizobium leguminosarum]NKM77630.1 DUF4145 domain-containing protein [Rhizobium leguminosarum bv. viciae]QSZ09937.1 DUF4145 domain-containing protein [Rhizobium leguminosarum]
MERNLWRVSYSSFPKFKCPRCRNGTLSTVKESIQRRETKYSKLEHNQEGWEPDWITESFICLLECGYAFCGEVVTVGGSVYYQYGEYPDGEDIVRDFSPTFLPHSMRPAPPVISLSAKLPKECGEHLKKAFELMWFDASACTNRIRTFVEALLDHFEIDKEGQNKKGELYRYNLDKRIQLFEEKMPGHKVVFDALRWFGNFGSHGGATKWEAILDAFQLVEYIIDEVIDHKGAKIKAIAQNIVDKKGDV